MKTVLHLLWDGHLGGVQRYVQKVINSGLWKGSKHAIFLFTDKGDVINNQNLPGIQIFHAGIQSNLQLNKAYNALKRAIHQIKADVIHCHCDTLLFMSQLRLFSDLKLVYTEHGDTFVRSKRRFITNLLWKVNGRTWDKILQNSGFSKTCFVAKFPFLSNKVEVTENPLLDTIQNVSKRTINGELQIGTVGRLHFIKGNDLFLNAIPHILKQIPNASFHIYGDGEERTALETTSQKMGLSQKITFHGYTNSPLEAMKKLDCLVVPSRKESFGLVALESMAVGTPVAAFSGTGISDFLTDGKNGYLAPMGDSRRLADSVIKTLSNKHKWQLLSKSGVDLAATRYSLKNHIETLDKVYDELFTQQQARIA